MKNYTKSLFILTLLLSLAACNQQQGDKAAQLEKLNAKLNDLKAKQADLSKEVQQVEADIAKLNPEDKVKRKEVAVTAVSQGRFDYFVQTQGAIESLDNIMISAKSMGIITQVYVTEGATVNKGQLLAQIDNTLVERGIDEVKGQLELANTVFERQKNLWDQKIGTEVQFLQAKNNKESLERRLASLNEQNDMTRIKAPITGVVDEVSLRVGQNIAPGMPAVRVISNNNLKVKANVSESFSAQIKKGNRVQVYLPDLKKTIDATVSFVGRNINQLSRTFTVEVKLPASADLRPNMTAVIKVIYESRDKAFVIPVNVVQTVNGEKIVYVAEKDGANTVARRKVIQVGGILENRAEVTSGLSVGDQLITTGYQGLNGGELVKI